MQEVRGLLSAAVLVMSMFCALRLDTPGSFPKPLPRKEEQEYLERASRGDMEARNILIERNLAPSVQRFDQTRVSIRQ